MNVTLRLTKRKSVLIFFASTFFTYDFVHKLIKVIHQFQMQKSEILGSSYEQPIFVTAVDIITLLKKNSKHFN